MTLEKGCLTGNKITGVRFRLKDGAHHMTDSSELSFILATQGAMKQAFDEGVWGLIEPIMLVEVTGPEEFQSTVLGNINKRYGTILNTETNNGWFSIQCEVALNDMFGYCRIFMLLAWHSGQGDLQKRILDMKVRRMVLGVLRGLREVLFQFVFFISISIFYICVNAVKIKLSKQFK